MQVVGQITVTSDEGMTGPEAFIQARQMTKTDFADFIGVSRPVAYNVFKVEELSASTTKKIIARTGLDGWETLTQKRYNVWTFVFNDDGSVCVSHKA